MIGWQSFIFWDGPMWMSRRLLSQGQVRRIALLVYEMHLTWSRWQADLKYLLLVGVRCRWKEIMLFQRSGGNGSMIYLV